MELNQVVFRVLDTTLEIYKWVVIASALLSFVNPDRNNPLVKVLTNLTEPVYKKVRSLVPTIYYNIDFAPLIVLLIIYILQNLASSLLLR